MIVKRRLLLLRFPLGMLSATVQSPKFTSNLLVDACLELKGAILVEDISHISLGDVFVVPVVYVYGADAFSQRY